jgi:hypothetical protein
VQAKNRSPSTVWLFGAAAMLFVVVSPMLSINAPMRELVLLVFGLAVGVSLALTGRRDYAKAVFIGLALGVLIALALFTWTLMSLRGT